MSLNDDLIILFFEAFTLSNELSVHSSTNLTEDEELAFEYCAAKENTVWDMQLCWI